MADKKQLWEINDVILNGNYSPQNLGYGILYSLTTGRADLPARFLASERDKAILAREEAERIAASSGRSAQNGRRAGGTNDPSYQLPSQKVANAPYIQNVLSSGTQTRRSRGKDGTKEGVKG